MASSTRDFVLEHGRPAALKSGSDVLKVVADGASLNGDLSWANGAPARTRRRSWLDTFDWRLYRAGLTLEQIAGRDGPELLLTGRDGEVLATGRLTGSGVPPWPALVSRLPAGPLRELIEPVAGIRALAPVARATSRVTEFRALNADAKTVARLAVDRMAVTFPARADAPPRLTLTPVRGYGRLTDRVGRAVAGVAGVAASRGTALEAALAVTGRRAGELPGKAAAVELSAPMPAARALAAILMAQLDSLEANVPGTVRDIDTEFLHDLRIAVRWTRSALKLCGSVLPAGISGEFRPQFRWLGDLTTPTRDLDVYLLEFDAMAAGLIGAAVSDLAPFRGYLERSRAAEYRKLSRGLRSARFARLTAEWRAALGGVRGTRKRPTVAQLAAERIAAAQRRALRTGQRITAASPPASLHDLRKRCKELRYLVEMFGPLHDPAQRWQAVRELKALQDCLGAFQDAEVQRTEVRMFAHRMLADRAVPAETLLAMGEVAAGLAGRQHAARAEFDSRFAAFASPASQARLASLGRAGAA